MPVTLTVWIPESDALALPGALSLIRAAPIHVEREGKARAYVATFANLPHALDLAVQLVGEVINVPNVCVMINGRRVASLTKFLSALICYRDSLGE